MEKNYYKILEVDSSASQEVIEKAYKALAKKYHPDLQEDSEKKQAEEKLKEINEAYEVLSDPASREKYDITLKNSTPSEEDMERISRENQELQNELNNLKHSGNQGFNNFVNQNNNNYNNNNYNPNGNNVRNQAEIQRQMQQKMQEQEYQRQLEYEAQMQAARQKAYHDAYIQDLKNRGYKIKYKKTPKEIFKNFLSLLITFIIVIILLQIPIVKRFFINLYNENPLIQSIVDVFIKKSN